MTCTQTSDNVICSCTVPMLWYHHGERTQPRDETQSHGTCPMKRTAYIETSVISYLTARPSRDPVIAEYQEVTREWWRDAGARLRLVASQLVVTEAAAGNPVAAHARLEALKSVELLAVRPDIEHLVTALFEQGAVPREAGADAAHIAIAATNGVDLLVTWNFRHIANADKRARIGDACSQAGYNPPAIRTPNELLDTDHDTTSA